MRSPSQHNNKYFRLRKERIHFQYFFALHFFFLCGSRIRFGMPTKYPRRSLHCNFVERAWKAADSCFRFDSRYINNFPGAWWFSLLSPFSPTTPLTLSLLSLRWQLFPFIFYFVEKLRWYIPTHTYDTTKQNGEKCNTCELEHTKHSGSFGLATIPSKL